MNPQTPKWKEFRNINCWLGVVGYVPGVCWKFLRSYKFHIPKHPFLRKKQPIACVCPSNTLAGSAETSCHDSGSTKKRQQLSQFGTPLHPEKLEPESMPGSSRCDLFGCFEWAFQGLSDLHLGDQKVTWKKLVDVDYRGGDEMYSWIETNFQKERLPTIIFHGRTVSFPGE